LLIQPQELLRRCHAVGFSLDQRSWMENTAGVFRLRTLDEGFLPVLPVLRGMLTRASTPESAARCRTIHLGSGRETVGTEQWGRREDSQPSDLL